jgi:arylformamidase
LENGKASRSASPSRRAVLPALALAGAAPGFASAATSSPEGPKVFAGYDQAALDAQFDQTLHAPNHQQILGRWRTNSDDARARLGNPLRLAYGPSAVQQLDIYRAAGPGLAPIVLFVHGGEWRRGSAQASAYAAEAFVRAGIHFIAVDFMDVEAAGGSLDALLKQLQEAVAWIFKHAADFGGDGRRIHIAGHSSGAHLAALLMQVDWAAEEGLPADVLRGGVCCSGLYDLDPVSRSDRSRYVRFTQDVVERLSPIRRPARLHHPVVLAYASLDSPEFQRQTLAFAAACKTAGRTVRVIRCEGYNHFEAIETLANPYSPLGRSALNLIARSENF